MKRILIIVGLCWGAAAQTPNAIKYVGTAASFTTLNCTPPDLAFATDATAGQNLYMCSSQNTWTQQSGGGGGGSGSVTQIDTTGPITGGSITTTGTIACTTCAVTGTGLQQFSSTTSAQLAGIISNETGSGLVVFGTSPTLVTPALGTPSALVLTNATGLPASTGLTGLGTGIGTLLITPSSANLAAAITDETGSGSLVFSTSPTLVTPALGTPASGVLTNTTGLPLATGVSGTLPIASGGTGTASTLTGLVRGSASAMTAAELSGDATTSGSNALTLATVNSNVGACGDATHISQVTLDAKGRATSCAAVLISGAQPPPPGTPIYTQTADATVANTVTETSVTGTGVGSKVLNANYFSIGTSVVAWASGYFSSAVSDTLNIKIKSGSTIVGQTGAITPTSQTNAVFRLHTIITCRTTGVSGTFDVNTVLEIAGATLAGNMAKILNTSVITLDTTATQTWDVTATWGTASASDTITGTNFTMFSPGGTLLTGDITDNANGVTTISNSAVTNAKIANTTIDLTTKVTGTLPPANGGTGQASYTKGDLLVTPGTTTINKLAIGTDGFVLTADAASTNGLKWATVAGGGASFTYNSVSFSGTPTFTYGVGAINTFKITLTANVVSSSVASATAGQRANFIICQDGTGSRTFAWPATFHGAMTVGSTASVCSSQGFTYDGAAYYADSAGAINQ